jgi:hypothetical protein
MGYGDIVCETTDWTTGERFPAEAKDFPEASVPRPALKPTQPPVQWVPEVFSWE